MTKSEKRKTTKKKSKKVKMGQSKSKLNINSKTHELNDGFEYEKSVQEPWFSLIKNQIKTVEGRPNKGFFTKIKKGDVIIWMNEMTGKLRTCKTLITDIRYYDTFYQMIETEKIINVLPAPGAGIKTVKDGVDKVYRQWYNETVEKECGVVAIVMKIIPV